MLTPSILLLSLLVFSFSSSIAESNTVSQSSFAIDYEKNQFLLDGKPFVYIAGNFHYFRTPKQYWRDRLRKIRAAGLNTVSTFVEWSLHQPEQNKWAWDGDADIVEFIKLAQEEDLLVLLRPGPYIQAEREFGGFPYWLLSAVPDIKLRTSDPRYMKYVEEYFNQLFTKVKPLLRGNGGPIIMIQVENEYGYFHACDKSYMNQLRDIIKGHVGNSAVLYTSDGPFLEELQCGQTEGTYTTVNFCNTEKENNVTGNFQLIRQFQPKGPLVNSDFYMKSDGYWKKAFPKDDIDNTMKLVDEMLSLGASVNFYMFSGGTNFGFSAGTTISDDFIPFLTSYDYNAPLNEAGDPTPKYFKIRKIIAKYFPLPNIQTPTISPKGDYGTVSMRAVLRLLDPQARQLFGTEKGNWPKPPTFESIHVPNWLVLYEADFPLTERSKSNVVLHATVKDRAHVFLDSKLSGLLSRTHNVTSVRLSEKKDKTKKLQLLVENQGRAGTVKDRAIIGYEDFKGIFNVTLNDVEIPSWNATGFKFDKILESTLDSIETQVEETGKLHGGPQIIIGHFDITGEPLDTFLNTAGWGKGIAFVNGHNLGRYWPLIGPQMTLYVPAPFLKSGQNTLVLVELENVPADRKIRFQTIPVLNDLKSNQFA